MVTFHMTSTNATFIKKTSQNGLIEQREISLNSITEHNGTQCCAQLKLAFMDGAKTFILKYMIQKLTLIVVKNSTSLALEL